MTADPGADPRAYRVADADGKPIAVFVGEGSVWLAVGGELARLGPVEAMRLGGRLGGAGNRALHLPARSADDDDRAPIDTSGPDVAYMVVADRLARRIKAGEFNGRRMPTGDELMAWYGVNRGVINAARRELIERGLIT